MSHMTKTLSEAAIWHSCVKMTTSSSVFKYTVCSYSSTGCTAGYMVQCPCAQGPFHPYSPQSLAYLCVQRVVRPCARRSLACLRKAPHRASA